MPMAPLFDGALFALEAGRALADEVVPRHLALAAVVARLDPGFPDPWMVAEWSATSARARGATSTASST